MSSSPENGDTTRAHVSCSGTSCVPMTTPSTSGIERSSCSPSSSSLIIDSSTCARDSVAGGATGTPCYRINKVKDEMAIATSSSSSSSSSSSNVNKNNHNRNNGNAMQLSTVSESCRANVDCVPVSMYVYLACEMGVGPREEQPPAPYDLTRQAAAELLGTTLLAASVIGSGTTSAMLSPDDDGVALLGAAISVMAALFVLINVFGRISGAHFNPLVSLAFYLRREMDLIPLCAFIIVQFGGAVLGALLAHAMFAQSPVSDSGGAVRHVYDGGAVLGEVVASLALLLAIFGCLETGVRAQIPASVALAIGAGHYYTSSGSFANPAVTVARAMTNTFTGIAWSSVGPFVGGQVAGLALGLPFIGWLFGRMPLVNALGLLVRRKKANPAAKTMVGNQTAPASGAAAAGGRSVAKDAVKVQEDNKIAQVAAAARRSRV